MNDEALMSVSESSVGSRFISQKQLDSAKAARDAQWQAAYARLGQAPPPIQEPDVNDGRSLAEKLAANKAAKIEEREERAKLANQFRALEEDEVVFLDSMKSDRDKAERKRKMEDDEEVQAYKAAIAARNVISDNPPALAETSVSTGSAPKTKNVLPVSKKKPMLKGVVMKKKSAVQRTATDNQASKDLPTNENLKDGPLKKQKLS